MKILISSIILLLLTISCNYSVQTKVSPTPLVRAPASAEISKNVEDGFNQPGEFLTEGEINEEGEAWIYSLRDKYPGDSELHEKVQEALISEEFPEKLKHELESIVYDYQLEKLTRSSSHKRN